MPEPEYQRQFGCRELSTRTATWFSLPGGARWGGEIIGETDETVRPHAERDTIDPDFAALVHAIELERDFLSCD
jgi:hypothetical protein